MINISDDEENHDRAVSINLDKDGNPMGNRSDQEDGWSLVGPRKKNKKTKK